jgi:hypothetical protein
MKRDDNLERFKSLFNIAARVAGTSNHFEDFKRSVEAFEASEQAQITAYNLLIDACAVFPYAGLLPGTLDSVQNPSDVAQLRWFRLIATDTQACAADAQVPSVNRLAEPLQGKFTYVLYKTLPDFTAHIEETRVKLRVNIHGGTGTPEELDGLQMLYLEFIDPFLLNRPLVNDGEWPPFKDARPADKKPGEILLQGVAVPLYGFVDFEGKPAGGFDGWVIFETGESQAAATQERQSDAVEQLRNLRKQVFDLALQKFARRVSDERMRELVEKDWNGTSAEQFVLDNFQDFGGWCGVTTTTVDHFEHICLQELRKYCFVFGSWDGNQWISGEGDITHIAIRLPDGTVFILKKREDTIVPVEAIVPVEGESRKDYGFHIARSVKDLFEAAKLRKREREFGFLDSAHDYSKDLNVLDRMVATFLHELSGIEASVDNLIAGSEQRASISDRFFGLHRLKEALDLRNRFVMAHERTQSQSRFFPQPKWCVELLKEGRRKDLYELILLLVWHPLGWVRYHQLAEQQNPDSRPLAYSEVADWSRMFAYDETGTQPEMEKVLGNYLHDLFMKVRPSKDHNGPERTGITVEEFGELHPPPLLNEHCGMEDQILWTPFSDEQRATRWTPHAELLPLLVFSLRAAFQHAWLRTFFDAAKGKPGIAQHIRLQAHDERHASGYYSIYRLDLDFPMPVARAVEDEIRSLSLPWGDWSRQMDHYRGKTRPWQWCLTLEPPVPPKEELNPTAIHTDHRHFRISIQTGI